jgi:molybdopterin-guanine dinucleotide biosynthesis protein A
LGETVLCGVIRQNSTRKESPGLRLNAHREKLEPLVPFLFVSTPSTCSNSELPYIEDQFDTNNTFRDGIHSVLNVLRQPVLVTSLDKNPPDTGDFDRLISSWNQSSERLSGVFFKDGEEDSLLKTPGLYASPLLPALREAKNDSGHTLVSLLASEPIEVLDSKSGKNVSIS